MATDLEAKAEADPPNATALNPVATAPEPNVSSVVV